MGAARQQARFDWLAELGAAAALAAACSYAALKTVPAFFGPAGLGAFAAGWLVMRGVRPEPRRHALPDFALPEIGREIAEVDELLLDVEWEEPLLLTHVLEDDDALLLEDALPGAETVSRVVQLFASPDVLTPGELKQRIDRHLAGAPRRTHAEMPPRGADASEALYAALDDLRRSLR